MSDVIQSQNAVNEVSFLEFSNKSMANLITATYLFTPLVDAVLFARVNGCALLIPTQACHWIKKRIITILLICEAYSPYGLRCSTQAL